MEDRLKIVDKPWYSEGLRFGCTGCGRCCTGAPGYVWVSEEEIVAMASHLNLPLDEFGKKYLRRVNGRYALIEKRNTTASKSPAYDCVFLSGKKCEVYSLRPKQCRTYPWWNDNLESPESWSKEATYCEGINNNAPLVSFEEIEKQKSHP